MTKAVCGFLAATVLLACCGGEAAAERRSFDELFKRKTEDGRAQRRAPKDGKEATPGANKAIDSSKAALAWLKSKGGEEVEILSEDGLKLRGLWIPSSRRADATVILAHGYSGTGETMAGFARFYSEDLGWNVLLPDGRAHGKSEGEYIGFGWLDRRDMLAWTRWTVAMVGPRSSIALHGVSMGAAEVLCACGEPDLPPQVKLAVSDCAFTSAYEEVEYRLGRSRLPQKMIPGLMKKMDSELKAKAGYSLREASALVQARKIKVPTLIIHGEVDDFVPFEMSRRLYDAIRAPKDYLSIPGAGHGVSFFVDPEAYAAFLKKGLDAFVPERG